MKPTNEMIKDVQVGLNQFYGHQLDTDGFTGPQTIAATNSVLEVRTNGINWSDNRKLIAALQDIINQNGYTAGTVDGLWGQQTQTGYDQLKGQSTNWRDAENEGVGAESGTFPSQNESALTNFYGAPGTNQGKVMCPYPLKIAWDTDVIVNRFTCHEKIIVPVRNVLDRVQDHYGDQISELGLDLWGGCYNKRKMRGGSQWSMHAWGVAIDWNPSSNQLRWKSDKASLAQPQYDMWWQLWEAEGFTSLGRAKNYDWMHVQAANV